MKIFRFDPETGTKGELIREDKRCGWTDCSVHWFCKEINIEKPVFKLPKSSLKHRWEAHMDGGKKEFPEGEYKHISYLADEWICFCTGQYSDMDGDYWDWVVLPPKSVVADLQRQYDAIMGDDRYEPGC